MTAMFSKLSRYRPLPEVHAVDVRGGRAVSVALRPLPAVGGEVRHALEAADRLDHLAYKYYRRPLRWWRICDANPEHLSPLALLGKEPLVRARFPVGHDDSQGPAPWPALLRSLEAPGVHGAWVEDRAAELREVETEVGGETVAATVTVVERAVVVRYNRLEVSPEELADLIAGVGFDVGPPQALGRVGKEIVIPSRGAGG